MRFDPAAESLCWFGEKGVIEQGMALFEPSKNERRDYCRVEWFAVGGGEDYVARSSGHRHRRWDQSRRSGRL